MSGVLCEECARVKAALTACSKPADEGESDE